MSSAHSSYPPKEETFQYRNLGPLILGLIAAGGAALLICVIGYFFGPKDQVPFSWLFAFTYFFTLLVGSLFWILVHYAVEAEWSVVVRRVLENIAGLFVFFWIFFIPLLLFRKQIYFWMNIPYGVDALLDNKIAMLNQPMWIGCSILFLGFFALVAWFFKRKSVEQDKSGDPWITYRLRGVSFVSILLFGIFLTIAAIYWLMGLNHHWFSTMFGVFIFAGSALSSMCLLVLVVTALRKAGYLHDVVTLEHYHIMGKLMLAFTVFWAYISFGQYFLIWYANIPEETMWFIRRNTQGWNTLNYLLVIGHFFVPFLFLLFRSVKRKEKVLCYVAGWILLMHALDIYIVVLPELHVKGVHFSIYDLAALIAIGAPLALLFLSVLGKQCTFPMRDPRLKPSMNLKN